MADIFQCEELPDIDQLQVKRGLCPWCLVQLVDGSLISPGVGDVCPECGDEFKGKLTITD